DDVEADAALDRPDAQYDRELRDVDLPAHDGLQPHHDLRRGGDRIDAAPGPRPVRLTPTDLEGEAVGARHHRARAVADDTGRERSDHVQAENGARLRIGEGAFFDHELGTPALPVGPAFFRGLKYEDDPARESPAHAGENLGDTHEHRGVGVVAAGVHHADRL